MRNKKNLLWIAAILIALMGFKSDQAGLISPGESVGQFQIDNTTYKQVQRALGKGKEDKDLTYPLSCGMRAKYHTVWYEEAGLEFTFYSNHLRGGTEFSSIKVTTKCTASLDKGLAIGKSTRADVFNAYGVLTPEDSTEYTVWYIDLGIAFFFTESPDRTTDTLTFIRIFEPGSKN